MAPQKEPAQSPLCFVIGPIGKDGSSERKHSDLLLNAVIKHVLKHDEFAYDVKRADEDADPGMIGDRVVTNLINAELVVADLTDLNPNAFYELGIRHSTEKPTIHIARTGTGLPFDIIALRTIFVDLADWHSIEQARTRLAESARAIKAPGYKVSNPITKANASFKMRQSEDPRDRVLAEVQSKLASLEATGFKPTGNSLQAGERNIERQRRQNFLDLLHEARKDTARKLNNNAITAHLLELTEDMREKPISIKIDDGILKVEYVEGPPFFDRIVK